MRNASPLLLLLIAYGAFIVIGAPDGVLNIAWTYMQGTFEVSLSDIGVLLGVSMAGRLLTTFISGPVSVRLGMGPFLLIGALLIGGGLLGYVLAPSWIMLLIASFVAAMGAGVIDAGLNTFVAANYSAGPLNWLHAAFGIGVTLGPPIATFAIFNLDGVLIPGLDGWRAGYLIVAALPLALIVALLLTLRSWTIREPESDLTHLPAGSQRGVSLVETLRIPMALLMMALFFVYGGAEIGAGQLSNTLFTEGRGVDQETATFWISMYWGTFTVGRLLMGAIADRISNTLILRISMIGGVIGAALLWLNVTEIVGFIGLALMGFAFAPIFAVLIAETPRRVGRRHAANAIGFQVGVTGLGGAILSGIVGVLAESTGVEAIGLSLCVITLMVLALHEYILRRDAQAHVDIALASSGD
ncbi:MAG: MFS transporter [Chloroflexi bacterium]|nr:MFS transporter [Chloroflexota bacterium]